MRQQILLKAVLVGLFGLAITTLSSATAETRQIKPTGVYAEIDMQRTNGAIRALLRGESSEQQEVIEKIKARPQDYAPPVLYHLSNALFRLGDRDGGAFWFYAGQVRARYDANRCADVSARQAVTVLNHEFGTPINRYMFQDIAKFKELIPKVVEWDAVTPHNYDHRWINLHGMDAITARLGKSDQDAKDVVLSLPEEQWDEIAKKTRDDYLRGFNDAIERLKQQNK